MRLSSRLPLLVCCPHAVEQGKASEKNASLLGMMDSTRDCHVENVLRNNISVSFPLGEIVWRSILAQSCNSKSMTILKRNRTVKLDASTRLCKIPYHNPDLPSKFLSPSTSYHERWEPPPLFLYTSFISIPWAA